MPVGVDEYVLSVFEGGAERDALLAFVGSFFVNVVATKINLRVVSDIIADKPVGRVIESTSLVCAVLAHPFQLLVLDVSVVLATGVPSPFEHLDLPRYFDEVRPCDS